MARHTTVYLNTVSKCQDLLNIELKKSSRLGLAKEVLYHPILEGGVGLPYLQLKIFSRRIIDFFASDMSHQNSLLSSDFVFPQEIKKLLRNTNISNEINSNDIESFSNVINSRLKHCRQIREMFTISAYKFVVFIELQFSACVSLQMKN